MNKIVARVNNQRLKNWKENQVIYQINSNKIDIIENIHINGMKKIKINKIIDKFKDAEIINKIIIVKYKSNKSRYNLVMGLKWLMIAKELSKSINCVIINEEYNFKKFRQEIGLLGNYFKIPKDTEDIIELKNIVVPDSFENSHPHRYKINQYTKYFNKNKCLDKPVLVEKGIVNGQEYVKLVDQYIRYLIFKKKGIKNIPVRYIK